MGLAFGPFLAGALIAHTGWRAIFAATAAAGLAALLSAARAMRESRDPQAQGVDWPGALTFTGALSLFTYGLLQAPDSGWGSAASLGLLGGAAMLLGVFIRVERRAARPMLDLTLFRLPAFAGVQLLAAAPAFSFVVLLVLLPARFIGIEGYSALEAGRMMIALSAPMLVLPILAGMAAQRIAAAHICASGLLLAAGGLLWLSNCAPGQAPATLIGPLLLIGCGISLPWGLMDGLAISVVPVERAAWRPASSTRRAWRVTAWRCHRQRTARYAHDGGLGKVARLARSRRRWRAPSSHWASCAMPVKYCRRPAPPNWRKRMAPLSATCCMSWPALRRPRPC